MGTMVEGRKYNFESVRNSVNNDQSTANKGTDYSEVRCFGGGADLRRNDGLDLS